MCSNFCEISSTVVGILAATGATLTILTMILTPALKRAIARKEVRRSHQDGFTLIELMIAVAIIAILAAIVLPLFGGRGSSEGAEAAAKSYYTKMYPEYAEILVSCVSSDSDSDGYVSCSGRGMKRGSEAWGNLTPLLCGGGGIAASMRSVSGCKVQPGMIMQQ